MMYRNCLFFFLMTLSSALSAQAGKNLKHDMSFFRQKAAEYQKWLKFIECDQIVRVDSVYVFNNRVTLVMMPAFVSGKNTCDSLQNLWLHMEETHKMVNKTTFHERLLKKWAFLCEISTNEAEVIVQCHNPAHFRAVTHGDDGEIPLDMRTLRSVGKLLPVESNYDDMPSFKDGNTKATELNVKLKDSNAIKVCEKTKKFCEEKYGKLPKARFIWNAVQERTDITDNEFLLEVTYITRVICPDGYYEYHKIYVQTEQQGSDVLLKVTLEAKYGSGIIWAPRKNDYKDMETAYKTEPDEYRNIFFKQILNHAK